MIEFKPVDSFTITGRGTVWTGPSPIDSREERAADFVGQQWMIHGVARTVVAVETHAVPRRIKAGQAIGVIFAPSPPA